jgi:transposase
MQHVAIDLGSRESQICVRNEVGEITAERKVPTARLPSYLAKQPLSRVVVETSSEAFFIADAAAEHGHQVRVVPATLVRQLGVGERGMKTDQRDARKLSEVSTRIDLPSVHVPSAQSRARKALCNSRTALLVARTQLINYTRGRLRAHAVVLPKRNPDTFPAHVREISLSTPEGLAAHLERVLNVIEVLNQQLKDADRELLAIAEQDPLCKRLMGVPGVGPVIAVRFVAVVDQPQRFHSAHHLMSYLGLTPGEHSSSLRTRRTGITKAGASDLRFALVQGCWSMMRSKPTEPMVQWALALAARRNKQLAVVALARKLVGILWAMWSQGSQYQSAKTATPPTPLAISDN